MFPEALTRYFADVARRPRGIFGWLFCRRWPEMHANLLQATMDALDIGPRHRVLEVGFGPGEGIAKALSRATDGKVIGVDLSGAMVRRTKRRFRKAIADGQCQVLQGDANALPLESSSVDRAFALNVVYFWDPLPPVIAEFRRVLRPGGRLALGMVEPEALEDQPVYHPDVFTLYTSTQLADALQQERFSAVNIQHDVPHRRAGGLRNQRLPPVLSTVLGTGVHPMTR